MKTMLLSFKPEWFEKIKNGSKNFEYRRSFANEEVMAYMYVSSPDKRIVGKIHLAKKISLDDWAEQYKKYKDVSGRIADFKTRHDYVMPILSFQMTEAIELDDIRKLYPKFVCPQMYYYLDNYPDLFEIIKEKANDIGEPLIHDFENIDLDDICRKTYKEV